ncbi:hypothetical protein PFDG_04910 [Plasmodium falciparum Dd2]|uniref:Uncharacterized protein n=1 Tax=Plasmodium falciparum (isolate Dd2) TaxID=57267 RepID=A0A0L7M9V7_PLAF4|nr:hypothetical protein PFDG_04910 [Plasmodium falciparum Dd2]
MMKGMPIKEIMQRMEEDDTRDPVEKPDEGEQNDERGTKGEGEKNGEGEKKAQGEITGEGEKKDEQEALLQLDEDWHSDREANKKLPGTHITKL